jgi:hypothetical protein
VLILLLFALVSLLTYIQILQLIAYKEWYTMAFIAIKIH